MKGLISLALLCCLVVAIHAHGMLTQPSPRTSALSNANNQRTAPCGQISKSVATKTYRPGDVVTTGWNIEADHGGSIKLYLRDLPGAIKIVQLSSGVKSKGGNTFFNVTLPSNVLCNNCTLQWVWESTEPTPYYGCIDINIVSHANVASLSYLLVAVVTVVVTLVFGV